MPQPTVAEFWNLLATSRLVDAGTVEALRREQGPDLPGGDGVPALAKRLVERGLLTRWQAKRLSAGNLGPFFLGDYRLLERHDHEGDALLFTARHDPSGRIVSVVLLSAKQCRRIEVWTEIVQRTTAASQAADPMLSRTWTLEQHESGRLIVCEHVEGTSLADELDRHGPLPAIQAGVLVSQIARAVAELHAAGSVHGSLSLDVLRREPPPGGVPRTGRVRLLQFPLAGDPHRIPLRPWNGTAELSALGRNAAYVAPELSLPGSSCDPRSDVYSIGAILYALVSGSPPCWAGDAAATLKAAALRGPDPLGPPAVTNELATLIGYLMARDPAERYQTAAEAAEAIAACLGLATAGASPPAPVAVRMPVSSQPGSGDADTPVVVAMPEPILPTRPDAAGPPRSVRRRAARLRLIGAGVTLAILAGTAGLVVSRLAPAPKPQAVTSAPPSRVTAPVDAEPSDTGVVGWGDAPPKAGGEKNTDDQAGAVATERPLRVAEPPAGARRQLVVDDPALPWASPTEGAPPRLAYLPPGSQLVLLARPAALAADSEGHLVLKSLGPEVEAGLAKLAAWCGCDVADIEAVQAGWQADDGATVLGGYTIRLGDGRTVPGDEPARREAWGATKPREVEGETVHVGEEFSFWVPSAEAGRVLVVVANRRSAGEGGGEPLIAELVRREANARGADADALRADLPRELEELVAMLDADRHITLFGSPHYLLTQGRMVLAGPLAKLAEPLEDLFGEAIKAAAVSVHVADQCYLEMDAIATLDVPAAELGRELATQVEGLADAVERYCVALDPSPYGRVLVMRLPQMLRVMVANMRSGAEGKGAILNAYLPRPAGHNLALATELALVQSPGASTVAQPVATPPAAVGALGRLEKKITLVFAKDTLEKSVQMISEEIGVPMDIVGPDLQLEGITKNQSFGLDARDKPARQILLEILAKANPDGKLVYIVRGKGDEETILVTTRAAAEKRGDTLPPGLAPAAAGKQKP